MPKPASKAAPANVLRSVLDHVQEEPSRTWSIIVTLFGDAVAPRGGSIWLGSILQILDAMQVSNGVVRTAMSRLASDGLLERNRIGRNSFYHLTEDGAELFRDASEVIYAPPAQEWDGYLTLIAINSGTDDRAKRQLVDAGYGTLCAGWFVAAHNAHLPRSLKPSISLKISGSIPDSRAIVSRCWPLEKSAARYSRFIDAFAPLYAQLSKGRELTDVDALVARLLLIHEFRRIALRTPNLPKELLPKAWPGNTARRLCADIYRMLAIASERWLDRHGQNETGSLPPSAIDTASRFMG